MEKSTKEIATYLLNRRNLSAIVMETSLKNDLGSQGFKTALAKRWIEIDSEQGYISITSHSSKIQEMRAEASKEEQPPLPVRSISEHSARELIGLGAPQETAHNLDRIVESSAAPVYSGPEKSWQKYIFPQSAGPVRVAEELPVEAPRATTPAPSAPATSSSRPQTPGQSQEGEEPGIGDTVVVGSNGKSYEAVVQATKDGKFTLSFGSDRPAENREFTREELKVMKKAALQQ